MKTPRRKASALLIVVTAFIISLSPILSRSDGEESPQERVDRINREIAEKGGHWTAGITTAGSRTYAERQGMLGLRMPTEAEWASMPRVELEVSAALPPQYDWRGAGGVSPAKDQGSCGSCWAFATVGQLESYALIYDQLLLDLSEQAIMACNSVDQGCNGGYLSTAYDIFLSYGAVDESCMPYEGRDGLPCLMHSCEPLATIDAYYGITPTVDQIKQAIYDHGPVACGMFAHDNLSSYMSGCYSADYSDQPNHGVLLIGWDDDACGGDGAWIMKNSWGTDWGYDGVGYIQYGVCSIGSFPYYIDYHESTVLVHVDSPNGGESLEMGEQFDILWTVSRQTPDSLSIFLSMNSGVSYDSVIVSGLPDTTTHYLWTVPELPVTTARVKVVAYYDGSTGGFDFSDEDFTIVGPPYKYVSPAGGNVYPYTLPRWAATDIQTAVDASNEGDSIMVEGDATYTGAVIVSSPVYLLGGWDSDFSVRDPESNETIISSVGSPVSFQYTLSAPCGIDGFTITNGTGRGDVTIPFSGNYGGGIFVYQSSPLIRNNIIRSNGYISPTAASYGGAVSGYEGTLTLEDNVIEDNRAQSGGSLYLYDATAILRRNRMTGGTSHSEYAGERNGGGIYAYYSTVTLEDNFIGNTAGFRSGGGIYGNFSTITMSGDTISSNATTANGAGICAERSHLEVSRAVITDNFSAGQGGGIYHRRERIDLENSIIAMNEASVIGGGMAADSAWGSVRNNTFDRNRATFGGGNVMLSFMETTDFSSNLVTYGLKYGLQGTSLDNIAMSYNNFFGNFPDELFLVTPDETNTSRDPHYADTTSFDYHLGVHSGAIDQGDPLGLPDPDGSRADQGAFGGPGAAFAAPDCITGLTATAAAGDSIRLDWDDCLSPGFDQYLIYASPDEGFVPGEDSYLSFPAITDNSHTYLPPTGCWYYRVAAINSSAYSGGFSERSGACSGADGIPPDVTVVFPNGGEFFDVTDTVYVQWVATDNEQVDSVSIWFSDNSGADYILLSGGEPNDSIFTWITPVSVADSCLIRVTAYDGMKNEGWDVSDGVFSVKDLTDVEDWEDDPEIPVFSDRLEQNYPNPFNGSTTIAYSLARAGEVELKIYDTAGRHVRTLESRDRGPGRHFAVWNGRDDADRPVTSGVYFCRIKIGKFRQTKKIVYMR